MKRTLSDYLHHFAYLRTDTSRAPHKPFLLLSVMDLIAQGHIQANFIEFDAELLEAFDRYWTRVMGPDRPGSPVLPFYHLRGDGFWRLVPAPDMEQVLAAVRQIRTVSQLEQSSWARGWTRGSSSCCSTRTHGINCGGC